MKNSLIEYFISQERFQNYQDMKEYRGNLVFSKRSYIPLSILEVALRNSIDRLLSEKIREDWHEDASFLTADSRQKIAQAKELLAKRGESTIKQKVIAELSLGFWVNLFKKPYDKKLRINDLKRVFPNLPPRDKKFIKREIIYKELNHIRNFRNRVFHYEKVINRDDYNDIFVEIDEILGYFDDEICQFVKDTNASI